MVEDSSVADEDRVVYSELVDLEARLLLMMNKPTMLNGPSETDLDGHTLLVRMFSRIYSAYQCTDLSDVEIALNDIQELKQVYRHQNKDIPRYVFMREASLLKRKEYFIRKEQGLSGPDEQHPKITYFG
jgi:hypothetical protein